MKLICDCGNEISVNLKNKLLKDCNYDEVVFAAFHSPEIKSGYVYCDMCKVSYDIRCS